MFVIFIFISVQVALQHPGLDRSLSLKRNLEVNARVSSDTIANVSLCGLAFVIDGAVHVTMFWQEHSGIAEDHKVTYIVRESLFLKSFREVYSKLHVCKIYNLINFIAMFTYETITMIKIVKISTALKISPDPFVISRPSLACFLSL